MLQQLSMTQLLMYCHYPCTVCLCHCCLLYCCFTHNFFHSFEMSQNNTQHYLQHCHLCCYQHAIVPLVDCFFFSTCCCHSSCRMLLVPPTPLPTFVPLLPLHCCFQFFAAAIAFTTSHAATTVGLQCSAITPALAWAVAIAAG